MTKPKLYTLDEALKAQTALRAQAGLGPEMFPLEAFVGMISDEIESLRKCGKSDDEIAAVSRSSGCGPGRRGVRRPARRAVFSPAAADADEADAADQHRL